MNRNPDLPVEFDENAITNESSNPHFKDILQVRLSRRKAILGGMSASAAFMLGGVSLAGCAHDDDDDTPAVAGIASAPVLGFVPIAHSLADLVKLPAGYGFDVLYSLGDPIKNGVAAWVGDGSETGASYADRAGDHHDAMNYFGLKESAGVFSWDASASDRGMLCINHENITRNYLHPAGTVFTAPRPENDALKEMNCHGVAAFEIRKNAAGKFEVQKASTLNRRYTLSTEMEIHGPVGGSRFAVTKFSTNGAKCRGTLNNCGSGITPWGTYLTGEENWAGYFKRASGDDTNALRTTAEVTLLNRYGIRQGNGGSNSWSTVVPADAASTEYARWDASVVGTSATGSDDFRHEPNTFGYMVEIDPFNPTAKARKRTALGRMAHEGCWVSNPVVGKPLAFYMGDDSRNEYIYKFVTDAVWDAADAGKGLTAGDKYLNAGKLYVAKFNADGTGAWVELTQGRNGLTEDNATFPFTSQAAVIAATRLAADAVGATKMDRPEWGGVNPLNGEVYMTLTNNSTRGLAGPAIDAPNPRNYDNSTGSYTSSLNGNVNGHIIRWADTGNLATATTFKWDIYLFGARASYPADVNLSALSDNNDFSSPDGIWFDPRGLLWIQTDDGAYTDVTNCMMLAARPGKVGDGETIAVGATGATVNTYKGKNPGDDNLRRFLVGPRDCEITGVDMTPDGKTMFVNIQHPGEDGDLTSFTSHWPDTEGNAASTARPRSSTIVIYRTDGKVIGV